MKKAAIIGSPDLHGNYKTALEKAGCSAVIFPDSSYVEKHPDDFDGLLLPGGGDVFSSFSDYAPYTDFPPKYRDISRPCNPDTYVNFFCRHQKNTDTTVMPDIFLDTQQLRALHLFYKQRKPIFGICKGMQLINLYFHGTIKEVSNPSLHKQPKRDVFHPADNLPGSFLHALFSPHMLVNSSHHQCVDCLGQDLQAIQHAPDGTVEAVSHLFAPVFGTQWHPERMPDDSCPDAALLFHYFVSLF